MPSSTKDKAPTGDRDRSPKPSDIYTLRAPWWFYEDLEQCAIIRPDGEIVTAVAEWDNTNRRVVIRLTLRAKIDAGWKVRLARSLLGLK